jgi:adenine-specific DNA methylase
MFNSAEWVIDGVIMSLIALIVALMLFAVSKATDGNSEIETAIEKIKNQKVKNELKVLYADKNFSNETKLALIKQYSLEEGYCFGKLNEVFITEKLKECKTMDKVPTNIIIEMEKLKNKITNNASNYTLYLIDNKYYLEFTYTPIKSIYPVTVYTELKNK